MLFLSTLFFSWCFEVPQMLRCRLYRQVEMDRRSRMRERWDLPVYHREKHNKWKDHRHAVGVRGDRALRKKVHAMGKRTWKMLFVLLQRFMQYRLCQFYCPIHCHCCSCKYHRNADALIETRNLTKFLLFNKQMQTIRVTLMRKRTLYFYINSHLNDTFSMNLRYFFHITK